MCGIGLFSLGEKTMYQDETLIHVGDPPRNDDGRSVQPLHLRNGGGRPDRGTHLHPRQRPESLHGRQRRDPAHPDLYRRARRWLYEYD